MSLLNSFTVSENTITADLTRERPLWKLSSYAPGRDPPAQLIDGKDVSPEEIRFRAWELSAQGMGHQFVLLLVIFSHCSDVITDIAYWGGNRQLR